MTREEAARVFKAGDLVGVTQFYNNNGLLAEGSRGCLVSIETGDKPIPYIKFTLGDLEAGEKDQFLIQWPERIEYQNEVLTIRDDYYIYVIKPKGKLIL